MVAITLPEGKHCYRAFNRDVTTTFFDGSLSEVGTADA